jgi:hypothetical protein
MTVTQQRRAALDDDDDGPYDKRYPGRKVVADGGRVRVPMHLTDGRPDWMPALFDASNHRPHQVRVLGDAEMRDARAASEASYQARNAYLRDAYRTMPSATGGRPKRRRPRPTSRARVRATRISGASARGRPEAPTRMTTPTRSRRSAAAG